MKRYAPEPDHYGGCDMCSAKMVECADGDYVLFDDAGRSVMCETNSNAILVEVRAVLDEIRKRITEDKDKLKKFNPDAQITGHIRCELIAKEVLRDYEKGEIE